MATVTRTRKRKATPECAPPNRLRLDVDDYHRLGALGFFKPDERVELIDGDIVPMSPIGVPHNGVIVGLSRLLFERLGRRAELLIQGSVRLDRRSEPEPDIAVLQPPASRYLRAHAGPKDILLIIEVMDSSAEYDRGYKLDLYARAKISEVWLVDLNGDCLETYSRPVKGIYSKKKTVTRGHAVAPLAFPDVSIAVDGILGPNGGKE
jgi:Uma2 family endonuclease